MKLEQAKVNFIESWGDMALNWGCSKTLGQIHALLLISPSPLNTDEIMEKLQFSRGNIWVNLKQLLDWELVSKVTLEGHRKEHFEAEKDMFTIFRQIVMHRKKQELEPLTQLLDECCEVEKSTADAKAFISVIEDIKEFSIKADAILNTLVRANPNWFMNSFFRMIS